MEHVLQRKNDTREKHQDLRNAARRLEIIQTELNKYYQGTDHTLRYPERVICFLEEEEVALLKRTGNGIPARIHLIRRTISETKNLLKIETNDEIKNLKEQLRHAIRDYIKKGLVFLIE